MKEEWRTVPNTEGMYEVSNLGNLRKVEGDTRVPVKPYISAGASLVYLRLKQPDGSYKNMAKYLKRIVYQSFGLNRHEITYIDGNPANNAISNLSMGLRNINTQRKGSAKVTGQNKVILDGMAEVVCGIFSITPELLTGRDRRQIRTFAVKVLTSMWLGYCDRHGLVTKKRDRSSNMDIVARYVSISRQTMETHVARAKLLYETSFKFSKVYDMCMAAYFDGYKLTDKDVVFAKSFSEELLTKSAYKVKIRKNKKGYAIPDHLESTYIRVSQKVKDTVIDLFDGEYSLAYIDNILGLTPGMASTIMRKRFESEELLSG